MQEIKGTSQELSDISALVARAADDFDYDVIYCEIRNDHLMLQPLRKPMDDSKQRYLGPDRHLANGFAAALKSTVQAAAQSDNTVGLSKTYLPWIRIHTKITKGSLGDEQHKVLIEIRP